MITEAATINVGDYVISRKTQEVAVVEQLGYFPGVFKASTPLDGEYWKSIDQVDILL